MHYILFVRLSGFYVRVHPESQQPLVIHRDKFVLDANSAALAKNIGIGMPLPEAKAVLQGGRFVAWEEEPYREAQSEWLEICADISDVIEPCEQHSAWIDLSLQPDAEALAIRLSRTLEKRFGFAAIPGLGSSKWIARLVSECSPKLTSDPFTESIRLHEPLVNPAAFLSRLKINCLTPVHEEHRRRLEFLGYSTIGEVANIPLSVLRSQFADAAIHIRMCARGGLLDPVETKFPPNSLSARLPFEGCVEDLQVLDEALKGLAVHLSKQLTSRDQHSKNLVVTLEHEDHSVTVLRRCFTKPIQNYASALASLRLSLSSPPERALVGIRARLEDVTASKRIQRELSGQTTRADCERGVLAAFQHVRTVFGDTAIQTGSELVEPRRKQVLRAWRDATGWT